MLCEMPILHTMERGSPWTYVACHPRPYDTRNLLLSENRDNAVMTALTQSGSFQRIQGISQGCYISPTLYLVIINDLLCDVDNVLQNTNPKHQTCTKDTYANYYFGLTGKAGDIQIMADACRSH